MSAPQQQSSKPISLPTFKIPPKQKNPPSSLNPAAAETATHSPTSIVPYELLSAKSAGHSNRTLLNFSKPDSKGGSSLSSDPNNVGKQLTHTTQGFQLNSALNKRGNLPNTGLGQSKRDSLIQMLSPNNDEMNANQHRNYLQHQGEKLKLLEFNKGAIQQLMDQNRQTYTPLHTPAGAGVGSTLQSIQQTQQQQQQQKDMKSKSLSRKTSLRIIQKDDSNLKATKGTAGGGLSTPETSIASHQRISLPLHQTASTYFFPEKGTAHKVESGSDSPSNAAAANSSSKATLSAVPSNHQILKHSGSRTLLPTHLLLRPNSLSSQSLLSFNQNNNNSSINNNNHNNTIATQKNFVVTTEGNDSPFRPYSESKKNSEKNFEIFSNQKRSALFGGDQIQQQPGSAATIQNRGDLQRKSDTIKQHQTQTLILDYSDGNSGHRKLSTPLATPLINRGSFNLHQLDPSLNNHHTPSNQQTTTTILPHFESSKAKKSFDQLQEIVQIKQKQSTDISHLSKFEEYQQRTSSPSVNQSEVQSPIQSPSKVSQGLFKQNTLLKNMQATTSHATVSPINSNGTTNNNNNTHSQHLSETSNSHGEKKQAMFPAGLALSPEIEELLRKELPNYSTDVPSCRQDVIVLQKWLHNGVRNAEMLSDEPLLFKYVNVSLNELIRQITLDCSERGNLLKEVIFRYQDLTQRTLQKIKEEYQSDRSQETKEYLALKKKAEQQIEEKEQALLLSERHNTRLSIELEESKNRVESLEESSKHLHLQQTQLKQLIAFIQSQSKGLTDDNLKLRIKLKKKQQQAGTIATTAAHTNQGTQQPHPQNGHQEQHHEQQQNNQAKRKSVLSSETFIQVKLPQKSSNKKVDKSLNESMSSQASHKGEHGEFDFNQPYIRKHTIDEHKLSHILQSKYAGVPSSPTIVPSASTASASKQTPNHLSVESKVSESPQRPSKIDKSVEMEHSSSAQAAIAEQLDESVSSLSSEESKLILDEAKNDMYNIEQLNAVGFYDPETAVRRECAETQVNDSLLALTTSSVETQTPLSLVDAKFNEFIQSTDDIEILIEFRISGLNQLKEWQEQQAQQPLKQQQDAGVAISSARSELSGKEDMLIKKQSTNFRPLQGTVNSYKGMFNKFEKMYEKSLEEIANLESRNQNQDIRFEEMKLDLETKIAELKSKLKAEQLAEEERKKKLEQERIDEENLAIRRNLQSKRTADVPEKWKNYQFLMSKKRTSFTSGDSFKGINAPKLGQRNVLDFEQKYQTDQGQVLVDKLSSKKYMKFKNFMPLSTLLKQINLIYVDRMKLVQENPRFKEISCANFSYIFLTKLFGLKQIVDQKYIIFILSIKKYIQVFRVNMFSKLLGIIEQKSLNYSLDEFNKYIEALDYITNQCNIGKDLEVSESDTKFYVPFIRILAFVGNFADSRMTLDETNEFKKEIEVLKEPDLKTAGAFIIDFDVFVFKMLNKYKMLVNRAKTYVINAFDASDLDGNGVCNLEEFLILNRNIEADNYNEEILTQIFTQNADHLSEGEQNLTFDKFAAVCVDFNLFSDEAQDRFLGIRHKREIDIRFEDMKTQWPINKTKYMNKIERFQFTEEEVKENWGEIIDALDERMQDTSIVQVKPLLIAERILDRELQLLEVFEQEGLEDEKAMDKYLEGEQGVQNKVSQFHSNIQMYVIEKLKSAIAQRKLVSSSDDNSEIKQVFVNIIKSPDFKMEEAQEKIQKKLAEFNPSSYLEISKKLDQYLHYPQALFSEHDPQLLDIDDIKQLLEFTISEMEFLTEKSHK